MRIKAILALLISVLAGYAGAQTQAPPPQQHLQADAMAAPAIDPQKATDIRHLLQVTGAGALAVQMMRGIESNMRPMLENSFPPGEYRPKLIDLYFEKFRSKATADAVITLVLPVYDKHFSDEEIKQLTAFYETPIGKKAIAELPQVVAESQQIGGIWGQQVSKDTLDEVLAEHPDLKKAMEQAEKQAAEE